MEVGIIEQLRRASAQKQILPPPEAAAAAAAASRSSVPQTHAYTAPGSSLRTAPEPGWKVSASLRDGEYLLEPVWLRPRPPPPLIGPSAGEVKRGSVVNHGRVRALGSNTGIIAAESINQTGITLEPGPVQFSADCDVTRDFTPIKCVK